jgi:hypothetical protein
MTGPRKGIARRLAAAAVSTVAALFLVCPAAFGQSRELLTTDDLTVTWGGYLTSLTTASVPDDGREVWNGAVTLRVKTEAKWRDRVTLTLHYEVSALWGGSLSNHAYRSAALADPDVFANLWWPVGEADRIVASHTLDRAYLTVRADPVNVIIGRQRIGWGVARFISPLDLFNPFDPMAIDTEERRGTDALVTEISLGQFTGMSLVFAPTFPMDDASYAVRIYTNRLNYDVSLVAGRFTDREVYGLDFSGQIWNIAVWGEAAWNEEDGGVTYAVADPSSPFGFSLHRSKSRYVRATLGAQYIFPNTLSVLVEYYYNGKGEMDKDKYNWEAAADGSEPALSRHYLFASVGYQITPLLTGSFSAVCNVGDGSVLLAPSVEYSLTEDVYLSAGAQVGIGEDMTEYGERPELYYLQIRYYF